MEMGLELISGYFERGCQMVQQGFGCKFCDLPGRVGGGKVHIKPCRSASQTSWSTTLPIQGP